MLFIDMIDIIYLLLGGVIGGTIVSYVDYMTCQDCKERRNNERA